MILTDLTLPILGGKHMIWLNPIEQGVIISASALERLRKVHAVIRRDRQVAARGQGPSSAFPSFSMPLDAAGGKNRQVNTATPSF